MTRFVLTLRSLTHYWRWHLGLFIGVMLAAAVISGSLVTGDSVRATLARQAEVRLGRIATAAAAADGFFTEALAERAHGKLEANSVLEPALYLKGSVTEQQDNGRAGDVNLYGVRQGFWDLRGLASNNPSGTQGAYVPPPEFRDGVLINAALARALGLGREAITALLLPPVPTQENAGQKRLEVIVTFEKPGFLSRDAPLSGEADQAVKTPRLKVAGIVADEDLGAFSLTAGQSPPLNAWLPLPMLQELADVKGRANLLLSDNSGQPALSAALDASLTAEDSGLKVTQAGERILVTTSRIFLADDIADVVRQKYPAAQPVLTYLVNEIQAHGKTTPYSMGTATTLAGDGTARVNQWLAEDLGLNSGDTITLKFLRVTRARHLEEAEATFTIGTILPMTHPDVATHLHELPPDEKRQGKRYWSDWMPDFPGITESEDCSQWKPGFKIRQDIIRPKDNAYWKQYQGTPKVWLPLVEGQKIWGNRFGALTGFHIATQDNPADVAARLGGALTPANAGLTVVAVRELAASAVSGSMDFGVLFVSMSAFLIVAALLLAALLFVFGIEQRARQCGVLRATGWTGKAVRAGFVSEALWITLPAVLAGVFAGRFYAQWALTKLENDWSDAALGLKFIFAVKPLSLCIAGGVTVILAFGVIWWSTRRLLRVRPVTLLTGSLTAAKTGRTSLGARVLRFVPIGLATAAAVVMLVLTPRVPQHIAPMLFFGAAFLLLIDGLRMLNLILRKVENSAGNSPQLETVWSLGVRNTTRRRGRSVALAGMLALGIFMVTALNAFRQDARLAENTRASGAGGFTFIGESTLPVYEDLNTTTGQKAWDFEPEELVDVKFVPFRVRDGEEASCLNLNRAQTPRVLGVSAGAMPSDAFPFASETNRAARWLELNNGGEIRAEPGVIPAIMDQYSAMFALGKQRGDIITVPDSRGEPVKLQLVALLAGTVLQGNVIISEDNFVRLYPDTRGYRYFLIDVPPQRAESFRKVALEQMEKAGLSLTGAPERLAQFQAVQNTYLTIFSTLGGFALLLSTIGLGVLVARHVMERRAEFAVLTACGFRPRQLRLMVLAEHWFLFFAALLLGSVTALLAVWPNLKLAGVGGMPLQTLALILAALLAGGLLFCWLAARLALTNRITTALRHE